MSTRRVRVYFCVYEYHVKCGTQLDVGILQLIAVFSQGSWSLEMAGFKITFYEIHGSFIKSWLPS